MNDIGAGPQRRPAELVAALKLLLIRSLIFGAGAAHDENE